MNGEGLFRYVNGQRWDNNTDFNIVNDVPDDSQGSLTSTRSLSEVTYNKEDNTINDEVMSNDVSNETFDVSTPGQLSIRITFTIKDGYEANGDGLPDATAILSYPSGRAREFYPDSEGLYLSFSASETGTYTITYYDLNARVPHVEFVGD